jgi:hypothetical protein
MLTHTTKYNPTTNPCFVLPYGFSVENGRLFLQPLVSNDVTNEVSISTSTTHGERTPLPPFLNIRLWASQVQEWLD